MNVPDDAGVLCVMYVVGRPGVGRVPRVYAGFRMVRGGQRSSSTGDGRDVGVASWTVRMQRVENSAFVIENHPRPGLGWDIGKGEASYCVDCC